MAATPPKLLALDTNVVLDLAEGLDAAHDFRETFTDRGYGLRLPPTAAVELRWKSVNDPRSAVRTLATRALAQLRAWDIQPLPELGGVEYAVAERFVVRLRLSGLLPDQEINIAGILSPADIMTIAHSGNQTPAGNPELEISRGEYTVTEPLGSHPREYIINATTGALITTHD